MAIVKETPHPPLHLELADDEALCSVTNLTYLAALGTSPYLDADGRMAH